jgi:hypothetical protein
MKWKQAWEESRYEEVQEEKCERGRRQSRGQRRRRMG